jgi:uncharacterized protein YndB with AHSA1/START domain
VIRAVLRLALGGLVVGWIADQWLRRRTAGAPPPAFSSLMVIDAPIQVVWRELADIEGQPRWMREMKSVRLLTPPPIGVGTRGEATVRIFGVSTTDPVEITEFDPPYRFAIRHEGAFTGNGVITLEPGADGTTTIVRWDETLIAPALPYAWALASAPIVRGIFQADLEHFRDLVESQA